MKPKNWNIKQIGLKETKVSDERHEQILAEVGEILYKRLCQQVRSQSKSPEPALKELEENQFKKAAST